MRRRVRIAPEMFCVIFGCAASSAYKHQGDSAVMWTFISVCVMALIGYGFALVEDER